MNSLTNAAAFFRQAIKWALVGTFGLIVLFILFMLVRAVFNVIFPPKPLPSTVVFGKLPRLDLSEGIKPKGSISYKIDTISGELPLLPERAKVFKISGGDTTFGKIEDVKKIASKLNFNSNPDGVLENVYRFSDPKNPSRKLAVDIATFNFKIESPFNVPELINSNPSSEENAIRRSYSLFASFGVNDIDFPQSQARMDLFRIDGQFLTKAPAIGSANLIQVNLGRADIDKLPIISPRENISPAVALVGKRNIISAKLAKQDIEFYKFSTYPLKGIELALEELSVGGGMFTDEIEGSIFEIREITIGYLENEGIQEYLQPIYMFVDTKGTIGYVDAISANWIEN